MLNRHGEVYSLRVERCTHVAVMGPTSIGLIGIAFDDSPPHNNFAQSETEGYACS